jgi:hypothetical protein
LSWYQFGQLAIAQPVSSYLTPNGRVSQNFVVLCIFWTISTFRWRQVFLHLMLDLTNAERSVRGDAAPDLFVGHECGMGFNSGGRDSQWNSPRWLGQDD